MQALPPKNEETSLTFNPTTLRQYCSLPQQSHRWVRKARDQNSWHPSILALMPPSAPIVFPRLPQCFTPSIVTPSPDPIPGFTGLLRSLLRFQPGGHSCGALGHSDGLGHHPSGHLDPGLRGRGRTSRADARLGESRASRASSSVGGGSRRGEGGGFVTQKKLRCDTKRH